jgi:molybdopterin-guanine dinucleotide biosynthesis protein B
MSKPKLLAVVGGKHSGKTTIIENLIAELKRRGFRVGTIKEMVRIPALDTTGKETDRYAKAGAEVVAAVPRCETVVFIKKRLEIKEIISYLIGLDVVLLEGFESDRVLPKVVAAKTITEAQGYLDDKTVAVSGLLSESVRAVWDLKVPLLSCRSQIMALADLVEQKALRPEF